MWYFFTNFRSAGSGSSGGDGGDDPNCKAVGEACSIGDSCCGSNQCINGKCGTCPSGTVYVNGTCKDQTTSCSGGTYNSSTNKCEATPICPSNPEGLILSNGKCTKSMEKTTRLECRNMTLTSLCGPGTQACCYVNISCPNGEGNQKISFFAHTCCNNTGSKSYLASDLMEWQTFLSHGVDKPIIGIQCKENGYCEVWSKNWYCESGCSAPPQNWLKTASFNLSTGSTTCPYGWSEDGTICHYSTSAICQKGSLTGNKCVWNPE